MLGTFCPNSFDVESEAYQALTELRKNTLTENYVVSQAGLAKNNDGKGNQRKQLGDETVLNEIAKNQRGFILLRRCSFLRQIIPISINCERCASSSRK